MIDRDQIAALITRFDKRVMDDRDIKPLADELGVDMEGALYNSNQRAIRAWLVYQLGGDPSILEMEMSLMEGIVDIPQEIRNILMALWLDGFFIGLGAVED